MPPESDVSPTAYAAATQIVHARATRVRRGAAVAAIAVAAVVFIVICVLVGESVSVPTQARAHSDAASELPSVASPIGMVAVLVAIALSLLATVVVLLMLLRSRASNENPAEECAAADRSG
jgi:hypothetical protein